MMSMGYWARRVVALLALVGLASCGGGTEAITPFEPDRMLVLGDEMSVLTKDAPLGRKYSVNALESDTTTLDCTSFQLWHQLVASLWDFAYEECNPNGLAVTAARIYATPGAKVDDLPLQLERAQQVNGSFSRDDLFMVLIGANDVVDLFLNVYLPNPTEQNYNAVLEELQARGTRLGQFVNRLTRQDVNGPKVIVSTIPWMNLTPWGRAQAAAHPDVSVDNALSQFSQALNTAMRVTIVNDGRFIGLVELDAIINAGVKNPGSYGLENVKDPVCVVALPNCDNTTADLVADGDATDWLWASDLWMGPTAHSNLGRFARNRAQDNPF